MKNTDVLPPSSTTMTPRVVSGSVSRKPKSSAMLWDSMEDASTELWIASLRDGLVSRIPSPAVGPVPPMSDGSGMTLPASSEKSSQAFSSGKTLRESCETPIAQMIQGNWRSPQMTLLGEWEPFCGIWPRWGASLSGEVYELPKWVPATDVSGRFSSPSSPDSKWTTPQSHDSNGGDAARVGRFGTEHGGANLADDVLMWQIPAVDSFRSRGGDRKDEMGLDQQARFWPSPAARDYRDPNLVSYQERSQSTKGEQLNNFVEHMWKTPHGLTYSPDAGDPGGGGEFAEQAANWESSLPVHPLQHGLTFSQRVRILLPLCRQLRRLLPSPYRKAGSIFKRKLNPDFVDWLMGWPVGWSSEGRVFSAEGMALYRFRLRASLRSLRGE